MKENTLVLDGRSLSVEELNHFVADPKARVQVAKAAISAIKSSHRFIVEEMNGNVVYGINTGFGPMASHILGKDQLANLQENLIRSHAVGMGDPIKSEYVLGTMVVRLNMLTKGFSGVSEDLVRQLETFINNRIIPVVPEHGAVGTSGDLVQLAHIALALIGEGDVFYKGERVSVAQVLKKLKISPYKLKVKEGLALINGTSMMVGVSSAVCRDADKLLQLGIQTGALALEIVQGFEDSFSEKLSSLRPHPGQIAVAAKLREILSSSKLLRSREKFHKKFAITDDVHVIPETVQEIYSLRCIPQVLGPVLDTLLNTKEVLEVEMNSVTDNPIIDVKEKRFLHGGNFHGDYVSSSIDQLKISMVKFTILAERRINFFLNANINKFLPPFVNLKKPGLTLGLQGLQFVATSTTANSQNLAFPQYVHSIPTNGDNQDIVSMGTDAALFAAKVIENAFIVQAIEMVVLAQAVDYLDIEKKLSKSSKELYRRVRRTMPKVVEDRYLMEQLNELLIEIKK